MLAWALSLVLTNIAPPGGQLPRTPQAESGLSSLCMKLDLAAEL